MSDTKLIQQDAARHHLFLPASDTERLDFLKPELNASSRPEVIRYLLQFYDERKRADGGLPVASASIMEDGRPALITGPSGAGKTTTIKALLERWTGPVFILDVAGEYVGVEKLDLAHIFSHDWAAGGRLRFVPATEISSQAESDAVLMQLNLLLHGEGQPLKQWLIVIEEGQRFVTNPNFKVIIAEGRKFSGKILVASQRWRLFKELVPVYLPPETKTPMVSKGSRMMEEASLPGGRR